MANTKLTSSEKELLAMYKDEARDMGVTLADDGCEMVMAYKFMGNVVQFAVSVMSPGEEKFRRKVGQFHALKRFLGGEFTILPIGVFNDFRGSYAFCTKQERKDNESW